MLEKQAFLQHSRCKANIRQLHRNGNGSGRPAHGARRAARRIGLSSSHAHGALTIAPLKNCYCGEQHLGLRPDGEKRLPR